MLAAHVTWSRLYDNTQNLLVKAYHQEIKKFEIKDKEVIAINLEGNNFYALNYLADKSQVPFSPETIERLNKENSTKEAFDKYQVKYILGYSDKLSEAILAQTEVELIATDSIKVEEPKLTRNQGWLLNLFK